ncbi:MAG: diguanylate cyclase/phosphodiesterase [Frankiales bacterium]|nr:diguanylate cyclase/phosphodiesterase [Frankiales bacterium]
MTRAPWVRFAVAGLLAVLAYLWLPLWVQDPLYDVVGLAAAGAVAAGLRLHRPARPAPWVLLGVGVLLWVCGDVAYSVYDATGGAPFPSVADGLYLSGYPVVAAAVAVVVNRAGLRDRAAWLDAGIHVLGVALLAWEPLLEPQVHAVGPSVLARVVALASPVLDLLILLVVLRLVAGRGWRAPLPAGIAVVLALYLVSDVVYGVQVLGGAYRSGSVVDLGWLLSYIGLGTLALHPRMGELTEPAPERTSPGSRPRLLLLGAVAVGPPGLLTWQVLADDGRDVLLLSIASVVLVLLVGLRVVGLVGEVEAVTCALREREGELHRRATTDVLTGLANRALLHERLEADVAGGRAVSVALLDLDDFKTVNDAQGHEAGDALLLALATRLREGCPDDLVARLGGDEFAVVSGQLPDLLAERLGSLLEGARSAPGGPSASVGVASLAPSCPTPSELLRQADTAMYVAKARGGGRAVVHRPEMSEALRTRTAVRRELTAGLAREEVLAWLQPVVDLATSQLLGFEALARWQRPGGPALPPASWLPVAEDDGLVVEVDGRVLRSAVRQVMTWTRELPQSAGLDLAVNASARTLAQPDVAAQVLAVLREEGLPPHRLVLEVTEGVLLEGAAAPRLQQLRDAGVRIALDDFGTGWSSLSYLRRFPVDVLKLDRSFVLGLDEPGGEAVPAAVVQLAAALGLQVVAEGIETAEQASVLRRLGVRAAQGYLFARPAPADQLLPLVGAGRVPTAPGPDAPSSLCMCTVSGRDIGHRSG